MRLHSSASAILSSIGLSFAFAVTAAVTPENDAVEPEAAMTCFAIAGKVTCIEAGFVPIIPVGPAVSAPLAPDFSGENEDIVIRDDGGRHVATG